MIDNLLNRKFSLCWMCVKNYFHYFKFSFASIQSLLFLLFHNLRCFIFCFWKVSTHAKLQIPLRERCPHSELFWSECWKSKYGPFKHLFVFWYVPGNLNHLMWIRHCNTPSHCNTPLHWAQQEFPKFQRPSQNHLLLSSKSSVFYFIFFWGGRGVDRAFYLCFFTFDRNLSRS